MRFCLEKMNSQVKEVLKYLCCNNGWSYGVFWRVNHQNSMLLTLEDAYFEQQIGMVIDKMLQQVHMLGEGIIGQAAFTGKHRWMFADTYCGEWGPTGSVDNQDVFQDNSQFHQQFTSGIKTIAVISLAPEGVVQFGSTHKIMERVDFADQIRSLFRQPERVENILLSGNSPALNSETYNPNGVVDSLLSSGTAFSNYWNINGMHDDNSNELMGKTQSSTVLPHSSPFTVGLQIDNMTPMRINSSLNLKRQFQNADAGQAISPPPNMRLQHALSKLPSSSAENSATMSTWTSNLISFERQMMSGIGGQETPNTFPANPNGVSCMNTIQNFQVDATSASYETRGLLYTATDTQFLEVNGPTGSIQGNNIQHSIPLIHSNERQLEKGYTSFPTYQGENPVNDLSQFFVQSLEHSNKSIEPINENPQTLGVASTSRGLALGDAFSGIPVNDTTNTLHNSTTDTINSLGLACAGKENSYDLPVQLPSDADLLAGLGFTFGQNQERECWADIMFPVGSGSHSNQSNGTSECVSGLDVGSIPCPGEDFFAEIDQLLDGVDVNVICHAKKPRLEDHLSTPTITGAGNASMYGNQIQLAGLSCVGGSMNELLTNGDPQKMMTMHRDQKEALQRSQVGVWIDDSYGINAEPAVTTQPKKPEEPAKPTRKRARPGESTRPRPKDRQQIQDRVQELRELVPNGGKCSIDALFGRTVKYLVFLESVANYGDKLKQADEPKMIGDVSGVVLKDNSSGAGGGGATWAFEVGGQTMICPIIVEDLSPPGQLLVEMLCEDGGFFLEIADMIRGYGLTILKGIMEVREDKIWARFVVEANKNITRMDIFLSLVQLLQQTATGALNSDNQPSKVVESAVPFTNFLKSPVPLTIGLADRLK